MKLEVEFHELMQQHVRSYQSFMAHIAEIQQKRAGLTREMVRLMNDAQKAAAQSQAPRQ
jgi:hypothetical protein